MQSFKYLCALIFVPFISFSQETQTSNPQYKAESNLLILRFVPSDKKAKIYLAGTKMATIDFNKDAKIISVVMLKETQKEVLKLNGRGAFYEVESQSTFPKNYELIVNARVHGKTEELKLQIKNLKP